jgi:AcrR family transcriptional regulator
MGRWEPGAADRLRRAALDLYVERGFDQTTVAEIAERAGLTARTFFRYYSDKREVLFAGTDQLRDAMTSSLAAAPAEATPLAAVAGAVLASAEWFTDREFSARRQRVIEANPELHERELIKMATLAGLLAAGLRDRGVADGDAALAAETAIAVFRVSFERWVRESDQPDLGLVLADAFDRLRVLTAPAD